MANKFRETTVAEVCEVFDGPHATPTKTDVGPIFLGITSLNSGRIDLEGVEHLSEEDFVKWTRRVTPRAGDVVFSYETKLGEAAIIPDGLRCCLGRRMALMRPDLNQVDSRFLLYYYLGPEFQEIIRERTIHGSTVDRIALIEFPKFPLRLPSLTVQKAIAHILGTIDDKIELNRRMNETLEGIARALFQSWFVDFDPVRAKLDGRQPAGMDAETAALFPGKLQHSPIGPIPDGWRVDRFDAHISPERGLSYKGEGLRDDGMGLPMHNLNSIYEGGGYKHEGLKYYAGEYREKHLLAPGDMIVTNTEQGFDHLLIGHAAIVPKRYGEKSLYSHHIYRVRFKASSHISPYYLVELFNNPRWHYWISGFSNGTTINMLPMDALEMPMFVVPPAELTKKFTALAESAHRQVEANIQQSQTLSTIRDTLLPKLLSGELSVANAESLVEDVAS